MNMLRSAVLLLLVCSGQLVAGQGLARTQSLGASQAASARLESQYLHAKAKSRDLQIKYKATPERQRASCAGSGADASMCGALSTSGGDVWAMATSPAVFSWTDPATLGSSGSLKNPFGAVGHQGECWTCVRCAHTCCCCCCCCILLLYGQEGPIQAPGPCFESLGNAFGYRWQPSHQQCTVG
ncbi:hypothetical protein COO60DRAFT_352935 [Scenedesmus sp. NREL 46B-D3]|nr:hypothetical protein COO60DRAFT_352935 [Scenedesmus sp. NREL 46B-D3]